MNSDEYQQRILNRIGKFYERTNKDKEHYEKEAARGLRPKRKQKQESVPTERQEQVRVAKMLDHLGLLWCHVPNEGHGRRGKKERFVGRGFERKGSSQESPTYSYSTRVRGKDVSVWRLNSSELKAEE